MTWIVKIKDTVFKELKKLSNPDRVRAGQFKSRPAITVIASESEAIQTFKLQALLIERRKVIA